jgi:hypothetical protein
VACCQSDLWRGRGPRPAAPCRTPSEHLLLGHQHPPSPPKPAFLPTPNLPTPAPGVSRSGADKISIGGDAVDAAEAYYAGGGKRTGETAIEQISEVYGKQAVVVRARRAAPAAGRPPVVRAARRRRRALPGRWRARRRRLCAAGRPLAALLPGCAPLAPAPRPPPARLDPRLRAPPSLAPLRPPACPPRRFPLTHSACTCRTPPPAPTPACLRPSPAPTASSGAGGSAPSRAAARRAASTPSQWQRQWRRWVRARSCSTASTTTARARCGGPTAAAAAARERAAAHRLRHCLRPAAAKAPRRVSPPASAPSAPAAPGLARARAAQPRSRRSLAANRALTSSWSAPCRGRLASRSLPAAARARPGTSPRCGAARGGGRLKAARPRALRRTSCLHAHAHAHAHAAEAGVTRASQSPYHNWPPARLVTAPETGALRRRAAPSSAPPACPPQPHSPRPPSRPAPLPPPRPARPPQVFKGTRASAALAAGIFHRREVGIDDVKQHMVEHGVPARL